MLYLFCVNNVSTAALEGAHIVRQRVGGLCVVVFADALMGKARFGAVPNRAFGLWCFSLIIHAEEIHHVINVL